MGNKEVYSDNKELVILEHPSQFSDDLIIQEILTRLPIKSILRFKSVSKQWYSTLSSSNFANANLMKSPFSHPSAHIDTLFIKCGNKFYLSSCEDDQISGNFQDNLVKLDVDFGVDEKLLQLTGCCNGLICLTIVGDDHFIIWNPATRKVRKYESDGYLKQIRFSDRAFVVRGFGYASSVDDYKYVRIVRMLCGKEIGNIVHIFSLREKKWRKIDFDQDTFIPRLGTVLLNEKLYMIADAAEDDFGRVIVSFDLGLEKFEIVHLNLNRFDFLGVMGRCLSLSNCDSRNTGGKLMQILESPGRLKSDVLPKELRLDMSSIMIGFTRTGKFFVTASVSDDIRDWKCRTLGLVDTATTPMQYSMLMKADEGVTIAEYVPSLVSPFSIEKLFEA